MTDHDETETIEEPQEHIDSPDEAIRRAEGLARHAAHLAAQGEQLPPGVVRHGAHGFWDGLHNRPWSPPVPPPTEEERVLAAQARQGIAPALRPQAVDMRSLAEFTADEIIALGERLKARRGAR